MKTINVTITERFFIAGRGTVLVVESEDDLTQVHWLDTITTGGVVYEIKAVERSGVDRHHVGLVLGSQRVPNEVPTGGVITLKTEDNNNAQG